MINVLPPPILPPTHTSVIYRCCESRWGISHTYDFYIEKAINLLYEHYDALPEDIRQHLIVELIKSKEKTLNFKQVINQSLRDEIKCREEQEEIFSKEEVC